MSSAFRRLFNQTAKCSHHSTTMTRIWFVHRGTAMWDEVCDDCGAILKNKGGKIVLDKKKRGQRKKRLA